MLHRARAAQVLTPAREAAEAAQQAAEAANALVAKTLQAGPAEELILHAMRVLPVQRALDTWRNGIEEQRARARAFKQASAGGVRAWTNKYRLTPGFLIWVQHIRDTKRAKTVMKRALHCISKADEIAALRLLKDHAEDAVMLRNRARNAVRDMAPNKRSMAKGLRKWVARERTAALRRPHERAFRVLRGVRRSRRCALLVPSQVGRVRGRGARVPLARPRGGGGHVDGLQGDEGRRRDVGGDARGH